MKRLLFLLVILLSLGTASAQDYIHKIDGTEIKCVVSSIDSQYVEFKKWNNLKGKTFAISRDKVSFVRFQDGSERRFHTGSLTNNEVSTVSANESSNLQNSGYVEDGNVTNEQTSEQSPMSRSVPLETSKEASVSTNNTTNGLKQNSIVKKSIVSFAFRYCPIKEFDGGFPFMLNFGLLDWYIFIYNTSYEGMRMSVNDLGFALTFPMSYQIGAFSVAPAVGLGYYKGSLTIRYNGYEQEDETKGMLLRIHPQIGLRLGHIGFYVGYLYDAVKFDLSHFDQGVFSFGITYEMGID